MIENIRVMSAVSVYRSFGMIYVQESIPGADRIMHHRGNQCLETPIPIQKL
jgi:hypothetical protein